MLKIGLTGGIASGKSLASRYFGELGIEIVDADLIAHDLFKSGSPHLSPLREHFGDSIFSVDGALIRKELGKRVFSDPDELEWLNNLTHPIINKQMQNQLAQVNSAYAILDIPLLVDVHGSIPAHLGQLLDRVLVIATDLPTQVERLMQRDSIYHNEAIRIINTQSSWCQKLSLADDVIKNDTSKENLKDNVAKLHEQYLKLANEF